MSHHSHAVHLLSRYLTLPPHARESVGDCLKHYYEGPPNVELVLTCADRCGLTRDDHQIFPLVAAELEAELNNAERRLRY